ncbi:MAG: HAD-IC family P-type ATPase, partial [Asgard group archaeon]|nr:HAD-IC family P-type ATPase [Asgard group archaeon]
MIDGYDNSIEEIYSELDSQFEGLSQEQAEKRLEKYGLNTIETEEKIKPLQLFFSQFKDLLVIILLVAGLVNAIIGLVEMNMESIIDVLAITFVVLLNAFLGFYQEYSAEKAIKALQSLSQNEVIIVRNKHKQKIESEYVVPGDIIQLEAGNTVVADIRLIQGYEIRVNESILTGESVTVRKKATILPENTPLADRNNMLYKGTTIVNGSGLGIIIDTGSTTELGKIASSLVSIEKEATPIQRKLDKLAKQLTIVILALSVIIFVLGIISFGIQGWSFLLIFAIGLAVAAVPEGLPTVLTLTMAIGITRMAKKNALIRKLPAVEVLGSTTVICTDKTGTLTRNEQTVRLVWTVDKKYNVTGNGYFKSGSIVEKGTAERKSPKILDQNLALTIEIAALANEASIEHQEEGEPYKIFGDPTEVALLILAEKGQSLDKIKEQWSIEYIFPFDSDRKRMSAIIKNKQTNEYRIVIKGALDILLNLCENLKTTNQIATLTDDDKKRILNTSNNYSANYAFRILGMAYRDISAENAEKVILSENYELAEKKLTFVGFIGMRDPPRAESKKAIREAFNAGMRVIMITGDHMTTAKAIGQEINLGLHSEPISGSIINKMTNDELEQS